GRGIKPMSSARRTLILACCLLLPVGRSDADDKPVRTDLHGDPLPPFAVARLGTVRLRQTGGITAVAFAPDGKTLVASGGGYDRRLKVWDWGSGKEIRQLHGAKGVVGRVVVTRDGKALADVHEQGICAWDLASG